MTLSDDRGAPGALVTRTGREETLSRDRLRQLNRLGDDLAAVDDPAALYPLACRRTAAGEGSVAMVIRVPTAGPLPDSPEALAVRRAGEEPGATHGLPSRHVSRRVLEAVRATGAAAMAGAPREDGQVMELTEDDADDPHAVLCAPVAEADGILDVLYLSVRAGDADEALLDYVQASARQVGFARKAVLLAEAKAERRALDAELARARKIQEKLTPEPLTTFGAVEVAIHYEPALWVGGDYCDVWPLADGRLALAVGDVSGKGLSAAMAVSCLHAAMRLTLAGGEDLPGTTRRVCTHLATHLPAEMFATLIFGVFDPAAGELVYINGGHLPPWVATPGGRAQPMGTPSNPPLGIIEHNYTAERLNVPRGAAMVIVTDGITEAMDPSGSQFGTARLSQLLERAPSASSRDVVHRVTTAAADFRRGLPPQDDTTVLAMLRH
jgi:sigma-B regulation protein RsbU (phosphoserine phosphatase)